EVVDFERVIAACGGGTNIRRDAPAPIAGLIESGNLRPDGLNLGLDVDPDGAARDAAGNRSATFSVLGSLRRGVDWETIGITELKTQSASIASRLTAELSNQPLGVLEGP